MTETEKVILSKISKSLKNSAISTWTSGDLDQWADYAKEMKNTIKNSTDIIDGLLSFPPESINSKNPSLSKEDLLP
jgi:hypothetical protein